MKALFSSQRSLLRLLIGRKRWIFAGFLFLAYAGLSGAYLTPILMYHHIDNRSQEWKLSVSPESFARQMEFLKAHRYRVMPLSEYIELLKTGKKIPKKSVVITFDDGYDDNFTNAFPVLKKMGFPATIFVQVDGIDREGYMASEDLLILMENGIEIGSNTTHHSWLPDLKGAELEQEIAGSKAFLERKFDDPVTLFAYPGGGFTREARQRVVEAGYEGAVVTHPGPGYPNRDPFALKRIRIARSADHLLVFWLKVSGFYTYFDEWRG